MSTSGSQGRRRASIPACIVGLGLLSSAVSCSSGAAREDFDREVLQDCEAPVVVAILDSLLLEASGIARDPRRSDLFWIHNDSGNEPVLFAVDSAGRLLAEAAIENITDRDVEDITIGRCGADWCAYIGDIGDNRATRSSVFVHLVPLPSPESVPVPPAGFKRLPGLQPLTSWELVFPDGARDAEGLVVDELRRELAIVSKGRESEVVLYGARLAELDAGSRTPFTLARIGRLAVPVGNAFTELVTAAELSPDGSWLALRSYSALHLLRWSGVFEQDTAQTPLSSSLLGAFEPQGEGVTWSADGTTLWLASEGRAGRPPQLSRIRCPDLAAQEPAANP
jgi:hypothetical protein